jgi:hypothetical protein
MRALVLALLISTLSGCLPETIAESNSHPDTPLARAGSNPHPNTPFTHVAPYSLALAIDPSIVDSFAADAPFTRTADEVTVAGWRGTLENGFRNGFARFFQPPPASGNADLTLRLVRADLSYPGRRALITYKAELLDANGRTLNVVAGTVGSKPPTTRERDPWDETSYETVWAATAVETLYEALARDLVRASVPVDAPPPPVTPPPASGAAPRTG